MLNKVVCILISVLFGVAGGMSFSAEDSVALGVRAGAITLRVHPESASPTVEFEGYCYDSIGDDKIRLVCLSYKWDFGDGSATSDLRNPAHTYASPGTYMVLLATKDNINKPVKETEVLVTVRDSYRQVLAHTKRELDLAIQGEGFFKLRLPNGEFAYTRKGSFYADKDGVVVNSQGYLLESLITFPSDSLELSVSESGKVSVKLPHMIVLQEIGQITLTGFPNPDGLGYIGDGLFIEMAASGPPAEGQPGSPGYGSILQFYREEGFMTK